MNKDLYDFLSRLGRFILPALGILYGSLADIWYLPYAKEVPATITAIVIFINAILKKDSDKYFGNMEE